MYGEKTKCVNNWVKGLSPDRGPTRIFFICSIPRALTQFSLETISFCRHNSRRGQSFRDGEKDLEALFATGASAASFILPSH